MNLENGPPTTYYFGFVKSDKFNVDLKCSLCTLACQYIMYFLDVSVIKF